MIWSGLRSEEMRAIVILAAVALTACQPRVSNGTAAHAAAPPAAKPAGVATDFSQPMIARGNEPFWAVRIEGAKFTLQRPDQPDVAFEAPGARIVPGKGVWAARSADGKTLNLTLYVSDCSEGMSDLHYPFTAEVELAGQTLRGCAAKLSDLPKAGG